MKAIIVLLLTVVSISYNQSVDCTYSEMTLAETMPLTICIH
jgi:hypothetical protein